MILDPSAPHPNVHTDDEVLEFWEMMERMVELTDVSQAEANAALVGYVKRACDNYMVYINSDPDLCRMAAILIDSKVFKQREEFCLSKLLSLLSIDLLELNMKFLIAYILLWDSKNNLNSLDTMLNYQGFNVFYNTCYTQFAYLRKYGEQQEQHFTPHESEEIELRIIDDMKQISTVLLDLLFQIFKYCKCTVENVQIIDDFFVYYLMATMKSDSSNENDMFNNVKFRLSLALNEQYMIFNRDYEIENKVYKFLCENTMHMDFPELFLLKFNRTQDNSLKIMMCKILYLILNSTNDHISMNFFYTNDLNVFVDVMIRELQNISDNDEILRNYYLRVLTPLLKNTELCNTHYKKDEINDLLHYLTCADHICGTDIPSQEQRLTLKLAEKCLHQVPWLETNDNDWDSDSTSARSSITGMTPVTNFNLVDRRPPQLYSNPDTIYSAESLSKRKARPPPPPPARKVRMP